MRIRRSYIVEGVVLARCAISNPIAWLWCGKTIRGFRASGIHTQTFKTGNEALNHFSRWQRFRQQGVDLTSPGTPLHLRSSQISLGFFSMLGVELALGREFTPQENRHGGAPAVVISDRLWRERFVGSPEVLGKTVTVDGVTYSIVGVAPPGFRLKDEADVYTPLGQLDPLILNNRATHDGLFTLARLKPGVSVSQAQAEMSAIQSRLDRLYPDDNRDLGIYVEPLKQAIVGDAGQTLALLLGAVGLVLLIACANVANLLLARSAARSESLPFARHSERIPRA